MWHTLVVLAVIVLLWFAAAGIWLAVLYVACGIEDRRAARRQGLLPDNVYRSQAFRDWDPPANDAPIPGGIRQVHVSKGFGGARLVDAPRGKDAA